MALVELEVEKVILRSVSIPLVEPFRISNGEVTAKDSIVIEVHAKDMIGYGEASAMGGSFYSKETPESTLTALVNDLVPDLLRRTVTSPVDYAHQLNSYGKEAFARAGMEGAVWDLTAQRLGTSIQDLIAPAERPVYSGLAIGIFDTIDELLMSIERQLVHGYKRVKIKIMPGWDMEPLHAVRKRFGDIPLMVDANAAYTLADHVRVLHDLDQFGLIMIEQPLSHDAYIEMAYLTRELKTPICADESADSMESFGQILHHRSAQIINIKVQRLGGLWNAKEMHDRAMGAGLECWLGTMPELGIASAQSLAIAGMRGMVYPTDVEASDRWYVDDIVEPKIEVVEGVVAQPASGFKVDAAKLHCYTTSVHEFVR
ncbi:MAG TPA: o-succinylbenzoate synthase [Candidatus Kapabacteria bacterium]|nr:o-succinylbenzoate synthase [Candidatus Kapabacteria bacterium]